MKALAFEQHGDLDQVHLVDLPEPVAGPGRVLLAVHAAALNRLDLWVLAGWSGLRLKLPHIMGSDGAGVVAAVGEGVTRFAVGDRVAVNPTICNDASDHFARLGFDNMCDDFAILGEHIDGFYAEFVAVPERNLLRLPDDATFETAAAASLGPRGASASASAASTAASSSTAVVSARPITRTISPLGVVPAAISAARPARSPRLTSSNRLVSSRTSAAGRGPSTAAASARHSATRCGAS